MKRKMMDELSETAVKRLHVDAHLTSMLSELSFSPKSRPIKKRSLPFEDRFSKRFKTGGELRFLMCDYFRTQPMHINHLPSDALELIFATFTDLQTYWRISLVCKMWMNIVWSGLRSVVLTPSGNSVCGITTLLAKLKDCGQIFHCPDFGLDRLYEITLANSSKSLLPAHVINCAHLKNLRILTLQGTLGPTRSPTTQQESMWSFNLGKEQMYWPKFHEEFSRNFFPHIHQIHIEGRQAGVKETVRCYRIFKTTNFEVLQSELFNLYGGFFLYEILQWMNSLGVSSPTPTILPIGIRVTTTPKTHPTFTFPLSPSIPLVPAPASTIVIKPKIHNQTNDLTLFLTPKEDSTFHVVVFRLAGEWLYISEWWELL